MFIYLWETESVSGEGQRERETQNPKQTRDSKLSVQSPMWGSNPQTVRAWPEQKPRVERVTEGATQAPQTRMHLVKKMSLL